ncbi:MAG: DUF721 domain-containing protein [Sedimentisphaerales bacterium]|nr:DUF721 domain-containing protein [Sedimentisphaerales bacterium]
MSEGAQIYNAIRQRKQKHNGTVTLSEALGQFMAEQISPRQAKYGAIVELWRQILPVELRRHCEITDISGGQLTVRVDSPSYKYELHLCSSELLRELQQQCPRARLTKIKFVIS